MAGPITPKEVVAHRSDNIPEEMFQVVNELLKQEFSNGQAIIKQDTIMKHFLRLYIPEIDRNMVYKNGWMDFEQHYRKVGWKVEYDKPGYNESYDAYFKFTKT